MSLKNVTIGCTEKFFCEHIMKNDKKRGFSMFTDELSVKLLQISGERKMTLEELAESSNLSIKFIGNIVNRKQTPKLDSFEKICSALEVDPNDLLISEKSKQPDKAVPMRIEKVYAFEQEHNNQKYYDSYPVCPGCGHTIDREFMAYCDRCGQKLSWKGYQKAEVEYKIPELNTK